MAEIAGFILGGIPLLISAMEHYQECFRILGCMHDFKQEYKRCSNRVKNFDLEYDLMLDKLFLDVVDSREELKMLKDHPDEKGWICVGKRLKERLLPKVHQAYLSTMRDLQETVNDLNEELGMGNRVLQDRMHRGKDRVPVGPILYSITEKGLPAKMISAAKRSHEIVYYEAQRAKFSLGKARRDPLFDQIETYMKSLDGLMSKNDDVARMLRSSQRPTLIHRQLLEFWRHSRNVYSLLSLSWKCTCHAEHCADLRLVHREAPDVHFELCLRSSPSLTKCSQNPWSCHKIVVEESKRLDGPTPSSVTQTPEPAATPSSSQSAVRGKTMLPIRSALKKSSKHLSNARNVKMSAPSTSSAVPPSITVSSTPRGVATRSVRPEPSTAPTLLLQLGDLCQAISTHLDKQLCSGLLTASSIDKKYMLTSPAPSADLTIATETTTLTMLLSDVTAIPNRVHRYGIALAIASSHLQLHSSHWLDRQWNGDDIIFDVVNGSVAFDQPHLRAGFNQDQSTCTKAPSVDETFTTLGILRLELCFGTTLEQSPFRNEFRSKDGQRDSMMD